MLWVALFTHVFSQALNWFLLLALRYCCWGFLWVFFVLASVSCHLFNMKNRFQFRSSRALMQLNNFKYVNANLRQGRKMLHN